MSTKVEEKPFEFILYINGNIVCQRYFDIRNYNEDVRDSYELKELVDRIIGMNNNGQLGSVGIIPKLLKNASEELMWKYYNPYEPQQNDEYKTSNLFAREDNFQFEIRMKKEIITSGEFCGNWFQPKVRYQVNLKEIWNNGIKTPLDTIYNIISDIRKTFSLKSYTHEYENYDLEYTKKLIDEYESLTA